MPATEPSRQSQGTTILLLGFLILLTSCALILSVRVHARLGGLTDELVKLNARLESGKKPATPTQPTQPTPPAPPAGQATPKLDASNLEKHSAKAPAAANARPTPSATRSPIPLPGEQIESPLPPVLLAAADAQRPVAPPPRPGQIVPWSRAHLHLGRTITVEGAIAATHNTGNYCFLNFNDEPRGGDYFFLIVFKEAFADFGDAPESYFLGKTVRVTGLIEMDPRGQRPQIRIKAGQQVELVK